MRRFGFLLAAVLLLSCAEEKRPSAATGEASSPVKTEAPVRYEIREGEALFAYHCATCHGEGARGDGFNAFNLDPKPRDLADPALQRERSDNDLASVIRLGGGAVGLSTGMPPWGSTLNDRQVRHLVAFIRALPERGGREEGEQE